MRVLITGVGGFAGSHLADTLLARPEAEVWGCVIGAGRPNYLDQRVRLVQADLRDPQAVADLLHQAQPDQVYHLAGQSFPQQSWADPWDTFESNLRPQLNLFAALHQSQRQPRILIVSSTEVYGPTASTAEAVSASEAAVLRPRNPYAVSKAAQDLLAQQYALNPGLDIVRARPSNHVGPRQNPRFVAPAFARQIAQIEAGLQPAVMKVGNLSARRDFTDVRDIVNAYVLLLEQGEKGEVYNVGTGHPVPVQALLDGLLAHTAARIRVEVDPALLRPSEMPVRCGDPARLKTRTGWAPRISLEQSLRDLLDYERALVAEMTKTEAV